MGIPTYTRWLCRKYPLILKQLTESGNGGSNEETNKESSNAKQNNSVHFDNFYIDMNGIIHNCSHNEFLDKLPETDDDMFNNIFLYE